MTRDLRKYASQTNVRSLIGFLFLFNENAEFHGRKSVGITQSDFPAQVDHPFRLMLSVKKGTKMDRTIKKKSFTESGKTCSVSRLTRQFLIYMGARDE